MNKSRITGLALAALGVLIVAAAGGIMDPRLENDVGPRLFPYIAGIGLIVCGAGVFLRAGADTGKGYLPREGWMRLLRMSALMVLYTAGLLTAGYLAATPVMLFVSMKMMGIKARSPVKTIAISLGLTILVYFIFERILHVMLPPGMFF